MPDEVGHGSTCCCAVHTDGLPDLNVCPSCPVHGQDFETCPACKGDGVVPDSSLVVALTVPQARTVLKALREADAPLHNRVWHQLKEQTGVPLY